MAGSTEREYYQLGDHSVQKQKNEQLERVKLRSYPRAVGKQNVRRLRDAESRHVLGETPLKIYISFEYSLFYFLL